MTMNFSLLYAICFYIHKAFTFSLQRQLHDPEPAAHGEQKPNSHSAFAINFSDRHNYANKTKQYDVTRLFIVRDVKKCCYF